MGIFPRGESLSLCAGDGHPRHVSPGLACQAEKPIAPDSEHEAIEHDRGVTTVASMKPPNAIAAAAFANCRTGDGGSHD